MPVWKVEDYKDRYRAFLAYVSFWTLLQDARARRHPPR